MFALPSVRRKRDRRYLAVVRMTSTLLGLQKLLIPNFSLFGVSHDPNVGAMGYIYGFIDCALQASRLEINCAAGRLVLMETYGALQDGIAAVAVGSIGPLMRSSDLFNLGVRVGGDDYVAWLKSDGKITPFRLSEFFQAP